MKAILTGSILLCNLFYLSSQPTSGLICKYLESSSPPLQGVQYSYFGNCQTPRGQIHILIVFVNFIGPDWDDDWIDLSNNYIWYHDQIPNWAVETNIGLDDSKIFNYDIANIGNVPNESNFYRQMSIASADPFLITATVYPHQAMINFSPDPEITNPAVCDWLEADDPSYDWGQFDSRVNNPSYLTDNSISPTPDDNLDYVVFVYRNPTSYTYSGVSGIQMCGNCDLDLTTNFGGPSHTYHVTNGHASISSSNNPHAFWGFFEHEFAHNLYNCPHFGNTNAVVGGHFYTGRAWGMMSGDIRITHCANAWEKWYLGWNDISASGIVADIDDISDLTPTNGEYTLRDFNTYGDAIRIKIPFSNDQYLWLENHEGLTDFDNRESWNTGSLGLPLDDV